MPISMAYITERPILTVVRRPLVRWFVGTVGGGPRRWLSSLSEGGTMGHFSVERLT